MKKILHSFMILAALALVLSCEKTPVGMTAVVDLAGDWYVQADGCDASGAVIPGMEDAYGMGDWHCLTYNTAADVPTEMYVSDIGNFWDYAVKVTVDLNNLTFQTNGPVENEAYDGCQVTITGGKITLGAATTPSGMPADAIEYYITFSDDGNTDYYAQLKIHGYRYTGFAADE